MHCWRAFIFSFLWSTSKYWLAMEKTKPIHFFLTTFTVQGRGSFWIVSQPTLEQACPIPILEGPEPECFRRVPLPTHLIQLWLDNDPDHVNQVLWDGDIENMLDRGPERKVKICIASKNDWSAAYKSSVFYCMYRFNKTCVLMSICMKVCKIIAIGSSQFLLPWQTDETFQA